MNSRRLIAAPTQQVKPVSAVHFGSQADKALSANTLEGAWIAARDDVAAIRTQKSGGNIEVHIPLLPPLLEALRAGPTAELAFVCGSNGKPMTKESFGNAFAEACRMAGIKKSAHGLRKIGATRAANNGATVAQLNAIFGRTGSKMHRSTPRTRTASAWRVMRSASW
jgi:integrase